MKKVVVVGGSTSGSIVATFLARSGYDVTIIYDHSNKGIGVGESTTPAIHSYLNRVRISTQDLLENTNSTIKYGVKFKNWLNDGSYYYHNFKQFDDHNSYPGLNLLYCASKLNKSTFSGVGIDEYYTDRRMCSPHLDHYAIHINTFEFGEYVQKRCSDCLKIVDGVLKEVIVSYDGLISGIELEDGSIHVGDVYIDATGFSRLLIDNFDPTYIDKTHLIPNNRSIAFQTEADMNDLPNYTLAEATGNGWTWRVPLQHRHGNGYIYSDKFLSDDEAMDDLTRIVGKEVDGRVVPFEVGYLEEQWISNCITVGLSSGFVEPLEATTIQSTIIQAELLADCLLHDNLSYQRLMYNKRCRLMFDEVLDFLRFHYYTRRTDTDFWRYMDESTPEWIVAFHEQLKYTMLTEKDFDVVSNITSFGSHGYLQVANGLGMISEDAVKNYLQILDLSEEANLFYNHRKQQVYSMRQDCLPHGDFIRYQIGD